MEIEVKTVSLKVQGHVAEVELSKLHPKALEAMVTYGVRRWFQDNINSAAKEVRDSGAKVDAEALFDARLKQAVSGEINVRGSGGAGLSPIERMLVKMIRPTVKTKQGDAYGNATAQERDKMCVEYLGNIKPDAYAKLEELAKTRIKAEKAAADALAATKVELDL